MFFRSRREWKYRIDTMSGSRCLFLCGCHRVDEFLGSPFVSAKHLDKFSFGIKDSGSEIVLNGEFVGSNLRPSGSAILESSAGSARQK